MDENGFFWAYPELKPYYQFTNPPVESEEGNVEHYIPLPQYENEDLIPVTPTTDPTLQLLEYFDAQYWDMSPPRPVEEILQLIKQCDPNRLLFKGGNIELWEHIPEFHIPRLKGPPDITIFHVFLFMALWGQTRSTENFAILTYDYLSAFLTRGIKWNLALCNTIGLRERQLRYEVIEAEENYNGLTEDPDATVHRVVWALGELRRAERTYDRLQPLFAQTGLICKRLGAKTIMSNPIFIRFMRSQNGPYERAWHPQTGAAFQKHIREMYPNETC